MKRDSGVKRFVLSDSIGGKRLGLGHLRGVKWFAKRDSGVKRLGLGDSRGV